MFNFGQIKSMMTQNINLIGTKNLQDIQNTL